MRRERKLRRKKKRKKKKRSKKKKSKKKKKRSRRALSFWCVHAPSRAADFASHSFPKQGEESPRSFSLFPRLTSRHRACTAAAAALFPCNLALQFRTHPASRIGAPLTRGKGQERVSSFFLLDGAQFAAAATCPRWQRPPDVLSGWPLAAGTSEAARGLLRGRGERQTEA